MIDECMAGNIDMVITKSISRFARNTLDCLKYIRLLRTRTSRYGSKRNPSIRWTPRARSNHHHGEPRAAGIAVAFAEREARAPVPLPAGQVQVNHNHFLGYTKDSDGHLVIDPEQAEVVSASHREYLEGLSMKRIAEGLRRTASSPARERQMVRLHHQQILRNEKYMGDALLQKTVTTDFLTKKRVRNTGALPQYYVEDDHEAIIPKDIFMQVQAELVRRRKVHTGPNGQKRIYSGNNCFSQMVVCGECGELYQHSTGTTTAAKALSGDHQPP